MTVRIFRHYVPTPMLLLGAVEGLLLTLAVYAGVWVLVHQGFPTGNAVLDPLLPRALLFPAIFLSTMSAAGLYEIGLRDGAQGIAIRLAASFLAG